MEKTLLEELKIKLEKSKQELEKELQNFAKKDRRTKSNWDTNFPNFHSNSLEEEADEAEEYGNLLPVERALETRLWQVNLALDKIRQGKYGICEKCGKEISQERLRAVPETKTCNICKL